MLAFPAFRTVKNTFLLLLSLWNLVSACLCTGWKCQHTPARTVCLTRGNYYHTSGALSTTTDHHCPYKTNATQLSSSMRFKLSCRYTAKYDQALDGKGTALVSYIRKKNIHFIKLLHDRKNSHEPLRGSALEVPGRYQRSP